MQYDTAIIRLFLTKHFSDGELNNLCLDYFPDLYYLTEGMDKPKKIQELLLYCQRQKQMELLMEVLEKERSSVFPTFFPTQTQPGLQTLLTELHTKPVPHRLELQRIKELQRESVLSRVSLAIERFWKIVRQNPRIYSLVGLLFIILLVFAAASLLDGQGTLDGQITPDATQAEASAVSTPTQQPPPSEPPPPRYSPTPSSTVAPTPVVRPTATLGLAVPPSNPTQGSTWTRPADGMVMIYIPDGTFQMGSSGAEVEAAFNQCEQIYGLGQCSQDVFSNESPQHLVTVDGFWMDQMEVTNAEYTRCVIAGDCASAAYAVDPAWNGDNYPVVGVSWQDAMNYCTWAGGRLPTEAEWEHAARGTDGRLFPWGSEFDSSKLNFCDYNCPYEWPDINVNDGYATTAPVGSYPAGASPFGILDMAGNVWEWVNDWYHSDYYGISPAENPPGPETGDYKVLRGGSWNTTQVNIRAANRSSSLTPDTRRNSVGFRCVVLPGG